MQHYSNELLNESCLCGSEKPYSQCCFPFHSRDKYPETAEQLMRSRYVAYAKHLESYLLETWHQSNRPVSFEFDSDLTWHQLIINDCKKGRKKDQEGWVTFTAFYQVAGNQNQFQEKSYFIRDENDHWCYVAGDIN